MFEKKKFSKDYLRGFSDGVERARMVYKIDTPKVSDKELKRIYKEKFHQVLEFIKK